MRWPNFTKRFVRGGTFPHDAAISLNRVLAERMNADYGSGYRASEEGAERALGDAERLLQDVEGELERRLKRP